MHADIVRVYIREKITERRLTSTQKAFDRASVCWVLVAMVAINHDFVRSCFRDMEVVTSLETG